ncbi:hypothetical protein ASF84_16530 [Pseudomonas sp. Leaf127]|nr:hypothetical protein ASF84_16530 [Pseudomonas sp. Leaf127]
MMDVQSDDSGNDLASVGTDESVVIAFADGVSPENRSAVLLSMKFAEAAARAQDNGNLDRLQWLENYEKAMFHGGWLGLGGKHLTEFSSSDVSLTMDSLVIDLIGAIAGPNKAAVLQLLSLTLDKLQGDDALMKLFEQNSKKGTISSFRIMPCLESPTGIPVTYLLALEVDHASYTGGALFWKWSVSRLSIRELVSGLNFDLASHNDNKHLMRDYIKGNAEDFFAGLPR